MTKTIANWEEKIKAIKGTYEANKEDLKELERFINKHGMTEDGLSDVNESFEQGYNNALEFVFRTLGVDF